MQMSVAQNITLYAKKWSQLASPTAKHDIDRYKQDGYAADEGMNNKKSV
jgi:hypothetical protein